MINRKILYSAFIVSFIFYSCSTDSNNTNNTTTKKDSAETKNLLPMADGSVNQEEIRYVIEENEKKLKAEKSDKPDVGRAMAMLKLYSEYVNNYPNDTVNNPRYIFKSGQLCVNLKMGEKAIAHFEDFCNKYPKHPKVGQCKFIIAFVYDETIKDKAKAKAAYESFIKEYPKHELVPTANAALQMLGLSDKELMNRIKSKQ